MPNLSPSLLCRTAILVAALGAAAPTAFAQGTAEQQEACTPDAVKLCAATIPDIPKTTACMKAHVAELSPRCRAAFADATGGGKPAAAAPQGRVATREAHRHHGRELARRESARVASREPAEATLPAARAAAVPAENVTAQALIAAPSIPRSTLLPGLASYRAEIARTCREGWIDAFTCRNTLDLLDGR